MVRKQVKALAVLYLVPCQHFGVYFAPYQILLVMGAVFVLLAIPFSCSMIEQCCPYATDACRGRNAPVCQRLPPCDGCSAAAAVLLLAALCCAKIILY